MDKIASLSHVRANLPRLIAGLRKRSGDRVIITRNGADAAVLISPEDLETLEILADRKLMLALIKAEEDIKAGRFKRIVEWDKRDEKHRRMTLAALADVDAGRTVDAKVVKAWAAGLVGKKG